MSRTGVLRRADARGRDGGVCEELAEGIGTAQMPDKPFANTPEFYSALGWFYAVWNATELAIDCATWKALGTETAEQAHERSAGTMFSEKCEQLRTLLESAKIPHGEKVKELLTQIEHHSMRNIFAHSFLASDEDSVTFVHRKKRRGKHGKYEVTTYQISRKDFFDHVQNFVQLALDFQQAVGLSRKEVAEFAAMALPLTTQEKTSAPAS